MAGASSRSTTASPREEHGTASTSSTPWWVMERCGSCRSCTSEPRHPSPLVQIETGNEGGCLAGQSLLHPTDPRRRVGSHEEALKATQSPVPAHGGGAGRVAQPGKWHCHSLVSPDLLLLDASRAHESRCCVLQSLGSNFSPNAERKGLFWAACRTLLPG